MKTINELQDGQCVVVAKHGENEKHFNGSYDENLKLVFFCMPDYYEIIGYIQ